MIEGVKIDITSQELKDCFIERVKHHNARAQFYDQQIKAFGPRTGEPGDPQFSNNDPRPGFENSARHHRERMAFFNFLAEHVISNETYRVSEQDLLRLELIAKYL